MSTLRNLVFQELLPIERQILVWSSQEIPQATKTSTTKTLSNIEVYLKKKKVRERTKRCWKPVIFDDSLERKKAVRPIGLGCQYWLCHSRLFATLCDACHEFELCSGVRVADQFAQVCTFVFFSSQLFLGFANKTAGLRFRGDSCSLGMREGG